MARKKITKELKQKIRQLRAEGRSIREVAEELGISRGSVSNHAPESSLGQGSPPPKVGQLIDRMAVDGSIELVKMDRPASPEELLTLAGLDPSDWICVSYRPNTWQGYAKVKTGGVEKVQLYQSKASFKPKVEDSIRRSVEAWLKKTVTPRPKRKRRAVRTSDDDQLLVWGLWDAHLGMYAWNREVGADFDLGIAVDRIRQSVDDMIAELDPYSIGKILMPVGNDFMHFDSVRNKTTFGDHELDIDSRYTKVYLSALQCLEYMVERALEVCEDVELLYVPGNHDYTSGFTLCVALSQRFRNDKAVRVDLGMNPRKYRKHGGVLLGFDHGKDVRAAHYPVLLASEAKELWAESTWREVQIGHTHQRKEMMYAGVTPTNGVLVRTNPSLSNVDAWHHSKGFIGEPLKSVEAWRYDRVGYRGSHVAWAKET